MRSAFLLLVLTTTALAQPKLKRTVVFPDPIKCPAVAATKADLAPFRATGELAAFALSIDAFLREDFGVAEAVALLGDSVQCGRSISTHREYELAPRDKPVRAVTLELYDDTLIGVVIELEQPIAVDLARLSKKYGPARKIPGIHRANEGVSIEATTPAFRASLVFTPDHKDETKISRVIYRRTPTIEILPDKFRSAADVARLVKLALRPVAPEPVRFYGTLGVFDKANSTADRDAFSAAVAMRNVAQASITHVPLGERRAVKSLDVTFAKPITGNLARALGTKPGKQLEVPGGVVTFDGTHLVVERR